MIWSLLLLVGLWALISADLVSLYALAVYIDPGEIRTLLPGASRRHQSLLVRLASDPRAFGQVATVYRSFALIVVTVSTLLIVDWFVFGTGVDRRYLYPFGMLTAWLLHLFFVEYLPRRSSRTPISKKMTRYFWLITSIYIVFFPVIRLYRFLLGRVKQEYRVTEEEKEEIVERAIETLAEQAGIGETIVEEEEKEMIGHIFLLDQTQVREIMSPRIDLVAIEKSINLADIQDLVRRDGHSRYPVYEKAIDKIIGMLYVKDLFSNMPKPGEEFVIANYLRKPYFVPESKVIGELQREFLTRRLHIAVVVDEYGGVAGLVTLEDILEEIVGEIQDEHDSEEADIRRLPDGRILVDPSIRVEKLQDYLKTDHEHEEYDTVGGLIYDLVGSVPDRGARVKWHDVEFEVAEIDGQRIKAVKVRKR